ncbi:MAG: hypothetical protein OEY89_05110 [Gammaproteobacteria bacterium]|nr:hypothetical protein [Gammaproteobacteria bacterium]
MKKLFYALIKPGLYLACLLMSLGSNVYAADFSSGIFEFQQKLANSGDAGAQYKLGSMYANGRGVPQDINKARLWYKKAAEQNHSAATNALIYMDVLSGKFDPGKYSSWVTSLKNAAIAGDGESMMLLGTLYENGTIVKPDLDKARLFFKQAAIKNVPGSEARLEAIEAILDKQKRQQAAREREAEEKERYQAELKKKKQIESQQKQAAADNLAAQKRKQKENDRRAMEKKRLLDKQRKDELAKQQSPTLGPAPAAKDQAKDYNENTPDVCKGRKAKFLTICR